MLMMMMNQSRDEDAAKVSNSNKENLGERKGVGIRLTNQNSF